MRALLASSVLSIVILGSAGADEELAKARSHFEKADEALNATWNTLRKALSAAEFKELQTSQRSWLEHRDYMAGWSANLEGKGDGKEKSSTEYWKVCAWLTEERTKFLKAWQSDQDRWGGEWMDSYGGSLRIVEEGEGRRIHFSLSVVRGPTAHTGDIAGVAKTNGVLARFTDAQSAPKKCKTDGETWLTFVRRGSRMEVIGSNTQYYHRARAYFDGRFLRVGDLDSAAKGEVRKAAAEPAE